MGASIHPIRMSFTTCYVLQDREAGHLSGARTAISGRGYQTGAGLARGGLINCAARREQVNQAKGTIVKSYRKELWFNVPSRRAFINMTPQVQECLRESGIREGLVLVNAMHITASVFINDDESGLHHDYEVWLEDLAPHAPVDQYWHNRTGEDNADAHLKRQIMGREVVVAVTDGRLDLGTWERIFYGEFDGRRRKRVLVKIIGE
jgi:secondary thiamine-phosphate synthase enzyme